MSKLVVDFDSAVSVARDLLYDFQRGYSIDDLVVEAEAFMREKAFEISEKTEPEEQVGKYKYLNERMPKKYFKAMCFALKMFGKGEEMGKAISIAADYYQVDPKKVNYYVSQRGGRQEANRKYRAKGQLNEQTT